MRHLRGPTDRFSRDRVITIPSRSANQPAYHTHITSNTGSTFERHGNDSRKNPLQSHQQMNVDRVSSDIFCYAASPSHVAKVTDSGKGTIVLGVTSQGHIARGRFGRIFSVFITLYYTTGSVPPPHAAR